MNIQDAYKKLDLAKGLNKERVEDQYRKLKSEIESKISSTHNDRLKQVYVNRLAEVEEAYNVLVEHFYAPNDVSNKQLNNFDSNVSFFAKNKSLFVIASISLLFFVGIIGYWMFNKEVPPTSEFKTLSLQFLDSDCSNQNCELDNCCIYSFSDGEKKYTFKKSSNVENDQFVQGNTYELTVNVHSELISECDWTECLCLGSDKFCNTIVAFSSSSNEAVDSKARTLNDLLASELNYNLTSSGNISTGEQFDLKFEKPNNLEEYFKYSLKCPICSSISKINNDEYVATTNQTGEFDIEVFITDSNTGEIKSIGKTMFESKQRIPNIDPKKTITHWLNNISNEEGFKMQTKWSTSSSYMSGYGTTDRINVTCMEEISNNGSKATVRVCYEAYDAQNNDLELIQIFSLTNYGSKGWKWDSIKNESVKVL
jgi:hypothetical protein